MISWLTGRCLRDSTSAARPVHFESDRRYYSQAKVQPRIVTGIKAALAQNALGLRFPAIMRENPGSDGAAIGLHSFKFHLDPIRFPRISLRKSEGGSFMLMMRMSMSPSLSKSPKAQPRLLWARSHARAGGFHQFFKGAIAEVAKHGPRRLVRILRQLCFDFRVNVPCNNEDIGVCRRYPDRRFQRPSRRSASPRPPATWRVTSSKFPFPSL